MAGPLRPALVALGLVAATLGVYAQSLGFDFVSWDDDRFVTGNRGVALGISLEGLRWAFTNFTEGNWTPLGWLSLQLDYQLAGLDPGWFHGTSVALHAANAVLLFLVMRGLSGAAGCSALVAALFALHPIHVESVAWISERRDVLSGLFGWLALAAWLPFVRRGGGARYALCWLLLCLALLSKPMWLTFPLLLLLLDYWPLRRLASDLDSPLPAARRRSVAGLVVEKLPLALPCLGAGIMAAVSQGHWGATGFSDWIPLPQRLANALVAYVAYLGKAVWPSDLSPLYPHPYLPGGTPWSALQVAGAAALLGALSLLALRSRRRYLGVGWLWYLVAMGPVIGVVQIGPQAMADRYAYLPFVGLYAALAFGLRDLVADRRGAVVWGARALCLLWLAGLGWTAHAQARHWRSSVALFEQAVRVSPGPDMLYNLANERKARRELEPAIDLYLRTVQLYPDHAAAHHNLGNALRGIGDFERAIHHYREAIRASAHWGRSPGVDIAALAERAIAQTEARLR